MLGSGFAGRRVGSRFVAGSSALAALSLAFLAACSAASDDDGGSVVATEDVPRGWSSFDEPPFGGYADPDWIVLYLDSRDLLTEQVIEDLALSASAEQLLTSALAQVGDQDVFFVLLDPDASFVANINILGCSTVAEVGGASARELAEAYQQSGIDAEVWPGTEFESEGGNRELARVYLSRDFDTYQTVLRSGSCYRAATLTTAPGDDGWIADSVVFLSLLRFAD